MTRDQNIEHVANAIIDHGHTPLGAATAIVDMLGANELQWDEVGGDWISSGYEIETVLDQFILWAGVWEGADSCAERIGTFPTLKAAKAAAQAHHEEQHWKRMRIWQGIKAD